MERGASLGRNDPHRSRNDVGLCSRTCKEIKCERTVKARFLAIVSKSYEEAGFVPVYAENSISLIASKS